MRNVIEIQEMLLSFMLTDIPIQQNPAYRYFSYIEISFRHEIYLQTKKTFTLNEETEINALAMVEIKEEL